MSTFTIRCPFCTTGHVKAVPGKADCRECGTGFEIDDKIKYIFVDLNRPRLPINGTYCRNCGLVQSPYRKRCHHCGEMVRPKWQ